MTRQEIFDKVVAHFAVQREAAVEDGVRMYRTPDGRKCAIGALIPDEMYSPCFEDKPVRALLREFPEIMMASGLSECSAGFLFALQDAHDSWTSTTMQFLSYFSQRMRRVAGMYELNDSSLVLLGEQGAG
jgi:hypothetical protein